MAQPPDLSAMSSQAQQVLDGNWDGASTRPAPRLYPHQWSWDSAFVAIGNVVAHPDRAMTELHSLLDAQWSNGMIPHIVFGPEAGDYFPSPQFWQSRACAIAPDHLDTSGICQPPVHGLAALLVAKKLPEAKSFASSVYEELCGWHEYLFNERVVGGQELVEIWHPWESGMDNSPLWDQVLNRINPAAGQIPEYVRKDTSIVSAADRPTKIEYDRYIYLVACLQAQDYSPADPTKHPFRVQDVLFNSLLVRSELALGELARVISADPSPHIEQARALSDALHRRSWSEQDGLYLNIDSSSGQQIPVKTCGGFMALLADPPDVIAKPLIETLKQSFLVKVDDHDHGLIMPSVAVDDAAFEPTRYWRGPAWVNIMWLLALGLEQQGADQLAAALRAGIIELVRKGGWGEYFNPLNAQQHGSTDFSWTAALFNEIVQQQL